MDFCSGQGVKRSNSSTIARLYNAALGKKTQFYVLDSVQHRTRLARSRRAFSFSIQFVNNPAQAPGETIPKPMAVVGDQFTHAPGGAASPGPVRVAELISGISWGASTFSNCTGRALVKS